MVTGAQRTAQAALLVALLTAVLVALALAQPWQARVDVGDILDRPFVQNFHAAEYSSEYEQSFRWSRPHATVTIPGAGRVVLEVCLHGEQPGMPLHLDAGSGRHSLVLRGGWQCLMLLPRAHPWSGDIHLHLAAPARVSLLDERERGVVVREVRVSGSGGTFPPGQVVLLGSSAALAVLLTCYAARRVWPGVLVGGALAAGSTALLGVEQGAWRLMLTCYSGRLVLVLASGGVLALATEHTLHWLARRGWVALAPPARRSLAAAALLAFLLRYGSMAYPLLYNSDIPIHMDRASLIQQGDFLALYLPNPALTPVQWESDITIPYSPFYYLLITPALYLPTAADTLAVMAFTAITESVGVVVLALLVLHTGAGKRAAVLAAVLAGMLPFGLLVTVSWGLTATLLGQFLALLALLVWLVLRSRLQQRWAQFLFAAALTLAYIAYPTTLLFLGTAWAALLVLLVLQRDPATLPTLRAGLIAAAAALILYYGWHIPALLRSTIPALLDENIGGGSSLTLQRIGDALWAPLRAKYSPFVLVLAASGAALLATRWRRERTRTAGTVLLAWGAAYPLFAVADTYVTIIHKHTLHMLPLLAALAGISLAHIGWQRSGRVVVLALLALLLWQALLLEFDMVVYAFAQLK